MKDNSQFKNWLKGNYSCSECNKEIFLFHKGLRTDYQCGDYIRLFFYHRDKLNNSNFELFSGEKICFDCYKKTIDKNNQSPYKYGAMVSKPIEVFHKLYQEELEKLKKMPASATNQEKIINYLVNREQVEKCSKCQNYPLSIFRNANDDWILKLEYCWDEKNKIFCQKCLKEMKSYLSVSWYLYDLELEMEKSNSELSEEFRAEEIERKFRTETEITENENNFSISSKFVQKSNPTEQKEKEKHQKLNLQTEKQFPQQQGNWLAIVFVILLVVSLIFLTILVFAKPKKN